MGVVWHDIVCGGLGRIRTNSMVDAIMKDYTDKAWVIIVLVCIVFWLIGCTTTQPIESEIEGKYPVEEFLRPNGWNDHFWVAGNTEEAETFPLEEEEPIEETIIHEDPILDLLIELNVVPTI